MEFNLFLWPMLIPLILPLFYAIKYKKESLKDIFYLHETIDRIITERERLRMKLSEFNWLKIYPSEANFILCKVLNGKAKQIHTNLQRKGIFIRYFDTPELEDYIRISVGKPEHTDLLIDALRAET